MNSPLRSERYDCKQYHGRRLGYHLLRYDFGHPWPLRANRRVSLQNYGTKDIIAFFALGEFMTSLGEVRSPLEVPVQELCNASTCQVMCTWTERKPSIPQRIPFAGLFPSGPRLTLIRRRGVREVRRTRRPVERQSGSGQIEPCRDDSPIDLRRRLLPNEEEVSKGFLIALREWGRSCRTTARPAKPPVRGEKP